MLYLYEIDINKFSFSKKKSSSIFKLSSVFWFSAAVFQLLACKSNTPATKKKIHKEN